MYYTQLAGQCPPELVRNLKQQVLSVLALTITPICQNWLVVGDIEF